MQARRNWLPRAVGAALATVLLAVSGCGGKQAPDTAATPSGSATQPAATSPATGSPSTGAPTGGSPTAGATTVTVTLTDFEIELSTTSVTAGAYTFVVEQQGKHPHALSIKGPGVDTTSTPTIQPGGASERLTVTLQPGRYELWCPVGNHKAQGMHTTITVR